MQWLLLLIRCQPVFVDVCYIFVCFPWFVHDFALNSFHCPTYRLSLTHYFDGTPFLSLSVLFCLFLSYSASVCLVLPLSISYCLSPLSSSTSIASSAPSGLLAIAECVCLIVYGAPHAHENRALHVHYSSSNHRTIHERVIFAERRMFSANKIILYTI